jgi:hypothetical protein
MTWRAISARPWAKEYPDTAEGHAAYALEAVIIPKVFDSSDMEDSDYKEGEDDDWEMEPFEALQLNFSRRNRALNFDTDFEPLEPLPPLSSEFRASSPSASASASASKGLGVGSGGKAAVVIDYGAEDNGDGDSNGFGIMSAVSAALEGLTVDLQRRRMDLAYEWQQNETAYAQAEPGRHCSNCP